MRFQSKRVVGLLVVSALAAASVLSAACGDLAKRLTSKVAAINLLVETRDPFAVPGVTPIAALNVNFIGIEGSIASPTASPIDGANVTLQVGSNGGSSIAVNESAPGSYTVVAGSAGAPVFVYASNQTYTVTMNIVSGDLSGVYTTKVKAPPRTEVSGLPDTLGGQTIPAGQALPLTLISGTYDHGFVVVLDSTGAITYSNKPQTPQDYLNFALGSFNGTITIPGTAFPNSGSHYGIVVTGLESAPESNISPNLEILSKFMAGSTKTAIVITN